MKNVLVAALIASAAMAVPSVAQARDGCGAGFFRGAHGRCYRVKPAVVVARPVIGIYYANRGYWHNNRYWKVRYRHRGGWRYR
jgi:hypothetical protein